MREIRWVIFSDLDGTFLDPVTYDYGPVLSLWKRLQAARIPVVFCSSKTRAEILDLCEELDCHDPFVCENGGAIYFEKGYFPFPMEEARPDRGLMRKQLGLPYEALVRALEAVEAETGCKVQHFGRVLPAELRQETGLTMAQARLARKREYDIPFWFTACLPSQRKILLTRLRRLPGIRVTRGGRFYHLKGTADKGRAVEILKLAYRRMWPTARFIGVGDSLNDLPMLRVVDVPILIRKAQGGFNSEILSALPHVLRSPVAAPQGWSATVVSLVAPALRRRPKTNEPGRESFSAGTHPC